VTDDLIAFIRAQLDDDERVAREATAGPWTTTGNGGITHDGPSLSQTNPAFGRYVVASVGAYDRGCPNRADAEHIARHDPGRVLAEVAAKRAVLDLFDASTDQQLHPDAWVVMKQAVIALAQPYTGRAGWREESQA
jgi:hypothetical protein